VRDPAVRFGSFCHVYNRGVDKRTVFADGRDYERFAAYLRLANGTEPISAANLFKNPNFDWRKVPREVLGDPIVLVLAFCLMPNHFHLVLKSLVPGGISKYMQRVETGYTMYFNIRNGRSGCLFQGRFKSVVVAAGDDRHLRAVTSYVHRNPVAESGLGSDEYLAAALAYPYSSAREYAAGSRHIVSSLGCSEYFPDLGTLTSSITSLFTEVEPR
jgi:putative transposase